MPYQRWATAIFWVSVNAAARCAADDSAGAAAEDPVKEVQWSSGWFLAGSSKDPDLVHGVPSWVGGVIFGVGGLLVAVLYLYFFADPAPAERIQPEREAAEPAAEQQIEIARMHERAAVERQTNHRKWDKRWEKLKKERAKCLEVIRRRRERDAARDPQADVSTSSANQLGALDGAPPSAAEAELIEAEAAALEELFFGMYAIPQNKGQEETLVNEYFPALVSAGIGGLHVKMCQHEWDDSYVPSYLQARSNYVAPQLTPEEKKAADEQYVMLQTKAMARQQYEQTMTQLQRRRKQDFGKRKRAPSSSSSEDIDEERIAEFTSFEIMLEDVRKAMHVRQEPPRD